MPPRCSSRRKGDSIAALGIVWAGGNEGSSGLKIGVFTGAAPTQLGS